MLPASERCGPATNRRTEAAWLDGHRVRALALPAAGLALAATWIWRMHAVWLSVPDFGFGWFVPLAAGYLAWERWADRPLPAASSWPPRTGWIAGVIGLLTLALLRLLLEPWPFWPAPLWLFTGITLALALGLIALTQGRAMAWHFAFPLAFLATALPWPSHTNTVVIQPLREWLAAAAAEFVSQLGYPSIAEGAVITVGGGQVGVDEACSGIRSLQAAVMAALFLGELQRFTLARRAALLAVGLALALVGNLARTSVLAWQAARRGPTAVAAWHDVAGYIPLLVGLGGLALIAWCWQRHAAKPRRRSPPGDDGPARGTPRHAAHPARCAWFLVAGLITIELGTQLWFGLREWQSSNVTRWTATLHDRPGFVTDAFTPFMQETLGCDAHEIGHWRGTDGLRYAGYVLNWWRGPAAQFKGHGHTPSICLPFSGLRLVEERGRLVVPLGRSELPFDANVFSGGSEAIYVYHLPWDVRRARRLDDEMAGWSGWLRQRWSYVAQARRHFEVTALAIAIQGPADGAAADRAFREELAQIIQSKGEQ